MITNCVSWINMITLKENLHLILNLFLFIRTSSKGHDRRWNLNTTTLNNKMCITISFISLQSSVDPFPFKLSLLRWYWIPTFLKLSLIYHYLYYKNKSCKRNLCQRKYLLYFIFEEGFFYHFILFYDLSLVCETKYFLTIQSLIDYLLFEVI